MEKERLVEIINIECAEFCLLNIDTGEKEFYKWPSKFSENEGKFTGLYYYESDSDLFFALIPTTEGPLAFYNQNIYPITDKLTIECEDLGKSGVFKIYEYGINIKYKYSKYLGFDAWSEKEDVDIFFYLFSRYKKRSFYEMYKKNVFVGNT